MYGYETLCGDESVRLHYELKCMFVFICFLFELMLTS